MAIKVIGAVSGVEADIDTDRHQIVTLRPPAFGALGAYSVAAVTGTIGASLAGDSTLFALRWGDATRLMHVRSLQVSGQHVVAAAAVAQYDLSLYVARSFTVADTGGTAITLTGSNQKRRTSHGSSLVSDMRIATTGTLTAGTRTLDALPIGRVQGQLQAAIGARIFDNAPVQLLALDPMQHPIILAANEGLVIRNPIAGPATATYVIMVQIDWMELAAY